MKRLLLAVLGLQLAAGEAPPELLRLENAQVVVEVAPRLGGRIATLRRPDGENMLAFDPGVLARPIPIAAPDGPYFHCLGHVIWVGPQNAWWTQQDANPARNAGRATWPPDPYLDHGAMQVAERTPERIRLVGPFSPVSGIRLETTIRIEPDGAVVQDIAAVNAGTRAVSWDIWPNTRARTDAQAYAPYEATSRLKVLYGTNDPQAEVPLPPVVAGGYLTFDTRLTAETRHLMHVGKAFLAPSEPRIFAIAPRDMLIAAARTPAPGQVHPEHAPVEVFQLVGGDPIRAVLELEFHSGYTTLAPGATLRFAVAWRVVPLAETATPEARLRAVGEHEAVARRLRPLVDQVPE